MLKQLICSVLAVAAIAPAASAVESPAGDRLYVVSTFNGMDDNSTSLVLPKVSDNFYKGVVLIDENPALHFVTALGDGGNNSLGAAEEESWLECNLSTGEFSGSVVEGKGNWALIGCPAGLMEITVDLGANSVEFKKVYVQDIWFVSPDIPEAATAPNDFSSSAVSYSGDLHYHYEALLTNGETCKLGATIYYSTFSEPYSDTEMWGDYSKKSLSVSEENYVVKDCSDNNPLNISLDNLGFRTIVKRSSFDITKVQFDWQAEDIYIRAGMGGFWLSSGIGYDSEVIDEKDFIFTLSPEGVENTEGISFDGKYLNVESNYAGPSVITVTATTPDLQEAGITKSKDLNILPWLPAAWVLMSNDAIVEGSTLEPVDGRLGVFEGTFTIPAGSGDFSFFLTDPSGNKEYYWYGAAWEESNIDLASGKANVGMEHLCDRAFNIPAEYRGNAYTFRMDCNSNRLQVFAEGIDPDKVTITPAETNPAFAVSGCNSTFRFYADKNDSFEFNVEGENMWINGNSIYEENGKTVLEVIVFVDSSVQEGTFDIVISRYGTDGNLTECYRANVPARYVPLESVQLPESIVLHVGEYTTFNVVTVPEVCSVYPVLVMGDNSSVDLIQNDVYYLLAKAEGEILIQGVNAENYDEVYSTTTVTVMPKEAAVAQHVFHAHMAEGDVLKLKLSSHDSNGYAAPLWLTSNESVATVDQDGNVTATGSGSAVITADCGDHQSVMGIHVGEPSGEISAEVASVKAYGHNGTIYVAGAAAGTEIRIFDTKGSTEAQGRSTGSTASFAVGSGVHMIAVGNDVFKIVM